MMKLSTLWRVDQTIDGGGRSPIADALLARWSDAGTARFSRSSANFTYRVEGRGATAFLRFADEDERSRAAIEQELALLRWLDRAGITVNLPIASRAGQLVETVETSSGVFHAVLLTALVGEQCEIDDLSPARFRHWGAALGQLHATLAICPPELRRPDPVWRAHLATCANGTRIPSAVRMEAQAVEREIDALSTTPAEYGMIHSDFELDNLIWQPGGLAILDLDEYTSAWFAADIAKALDERLETGAGFDDPGIVAFIEGYRSRHPLTGEQLAAIPLMRRLRALHDYAVLTRACDLPDDFDGPGWLLGLDRRLHAWLRDYERALPRIA